MKAYRTVLVSAVAYSVVSYDVIGVSSYLSANRFNLMTQNNNKWRSAMLSVLLIESLDLSRSIASSLVTS